MTAFPEFQIGLALVKVTVLLATAIALICFTGRAEPRWRLLIARAAIVAIPVLLLAAAASPIIRVEIFPEEFPKPTPAAPVPATPSELAIPEHANVNAPSLPLADPPPAGTPIGASFSLALLWITIAALLIFREWLRFRKVAVSARAGGAAPEDLTHTWERICADSQVERAPVLGLVPQALSPVLLPGRPGRLLIPICLTDPSERETLHHVFQHEAAHLRHHDRSWLPAMRILSSLFWFHPLLWWLAALHQKACEEAADAEAARRGGTESYRSALARLALDLVPVRGATPAFLRLPSVVRRLRAVSGFARLNPPASAITLLVAVAIAGFGAGLGNLGIGQETDSAMEKRADFLARVSAGWDNPNDDIEVEAGGEKTLKFLSSYLCNISLDEVPAKTATHLLEKMLASPEDDEAETGPSEIRIILHPDIDPKIPITLRLSNVPASEALVYIARLAGGSVRIEDDVAEIVPGKKSGKGRAEPPDRNASTLTEDERNRVREADLIALDGSKLLAMGKVDEAITAFLAALELLPEKDIVRVRRESFRAQARHAISRMQPGNSRPVQGEIRKGHGPERPEPLSDALVEKKLRQLILPSIEFVNTPHKDAIASLERMSQIADRDEIDPKRRGVRIDFQAAPHPTTKITLRLADVPLAEALDYTTKLVNVTYQVEDGVVRVVPKGITGREVFTNTYDAPLQVFIDPNTGNERTPKDLLGEIGVAFPEGTNAIYNREAQTLIIRNTSANISLVETWLKERLSRMNADPSEIWFEAFSTLQEVEKAATNPAKRDENLKLSKQALAGFIQLRDEYPDFYKDIVDFRIDQLEKLIAEFGAAKPVGTPLPGSPPSAGIASPAGPPARSLESVLMGIKFPDLKITNYQLEPAFRHVIQLAQRKVPADDPPALRKARIQFDSNVDHTSRVTVRIEEPLTARSALDRIAMEAGVKCVIIGDTLFGYPVNALEDPLNVTTYTLPAELFERLKGDEPDAKAMLVKAGISFPPDTAAIYVGAKKALIVRHTQSVHEQIEKWLEENDAPKP